jgi:hypothetical protein
MRKSFAEGRHSCDLEIGSPRAQPAPHRQHSERFVKRGVGLKMLTGTGAQIDTTTLSVGFNTQPEQTPALDVPA